MARLREAAKAVQQDDGPASQADLSADEDDADIKAFEAEEREKERQRLAAYERLKKAARKRRRPE